MEIHGKWENHGFHLPRPYPCKAKSMEILIYKATPYGFHWNPMEIHWNPMESDGSPMESNGNLMESNGI